jgi:DNA-binding transcriptional ArsR family regulator
MGKSHQNVLEVLRAVDEYTQNGDSFFTVSNLYSDMEMSQYQYDMSEKTVRRILSEVEHQGLVEYREVSNTKLYVVTDEELIPSLSKLYH